MRRILACVFSTALAAAMSWGQFVTADVRPSKPGGDDRGGMFSNGIVDLRSVTMLDLISMSYDLTSDRILGGPNWLDSNRYDIFAKAPDGTPDEALAKLVQGLLADRFKLAVHNDQKPAPIFALTAGKKPKLKDASGPGDAECKISVNGSLRTYTCRNMTMAGLVQRVRGVAAAYLDHDVVDQTGLTGSYDFALTWTPRGQLSKDGDPATNISFFDAVDKQLGLKIEAGTQPMAVIVVDHVEATPTASGPAKPEKPLPTEFEVADLKPSKPGTTRTNGRLTKGGRVELTGMTLKDLVTTAWDLNDDMISYPKWMATERFDLIAKAGMDVPIDTLLTMLRALLTERFKIKSHTEEQPVPVYALMTTKSPHKLKASDESARSGCKPGNADGLRTLTCQNITMEQFVEKLREAAPGYFDHKVVDTTGLKGGFDVTVAWSPKGRMELNANKARESAEAASSPNGDLTVFQAVEKQLGLKLAEQKRPMQVLVIDHIDRTPVEN
jgi:uncharacterized protein (TIGR03435 family)